jgi:hypothetical protein
MAPLAYPAYALAWYDIPAGGCGVIRTSSRWVFPGGLPVRCTPRGVKNEKGRKIRPLHFGSGGAYLVDCEGVLMPPLSSLTLSAEQATADTLPKAKSEHNNAAIKRFMASPVDWEIPL